jgi:hypothetical protein
MEEVSGTYFTSIAQDTTKNKPAVESYLPFSRSRYP